MTTVVDNIVYGDMLARRRASHGRSGAWVAQQIGMDVDTYFKKEQGFEAFTDVERAAIDKVTY